jgi:class 3 adenylate cyclase/TolB-like protein
VEGKQTDVEVPPERRLAAILAAAIDGPSVLTSDDAGAHQRVSQALDHLRSAIQHASGTIFSFAGDGIMAEFTSATEALTCAIRIQAASARRMESEAEPIRFRIAVNAGEILAGTRHLGGTAISLAAGLARIAQPGCIALPGTLHDQLRQAVPVVADPMGQPDLSGLDEPVVVVSISSDACLAWTGAGRTVRKSPAARLAGDPRASLAIVPFRPSGNDEGFAGSATNGVIRTLGGMSTWLVVTRTPAATAREPIDLHRVRQTSGARYILHGSVETERDLLRLTVELNEAETGRVLWSDRFDHPRGEQVALREDAASRIARAIPPLVLQRELDRSALAPPDTLTAHDLALRAYTAIMQPERETFASAAEMLRQAEQRPGPHASTWLALVWWHFMAISQGWCANPAAEALAAAEAASHMDRNDPSAMALLAFMHSVRYRDHIVAAAMLDRVIDAAPFCGMAECLKALTLSWLGDAEAAIFHAEQAGMLPALGPERAWQDHVTAGAHYIAGRYGDAARWARVSAMHHPRLAANARVLAASLAVLGRLDEAHQAARQLLAIDPDFRIGVWRERAMLPAESRDTLARRLRLAGVPG